MNTTLLKNRSFSSIWLGQSFLNFALVFYVIAMVTVLFLKNNSLLDATLFPLVRYGSSWIGGMLAPGVIQRMPLRSFLIAVQWVQVLLMLGLALYLTQCEMNIFMVLLFIVGISFLEGWSTPARNAMIPLIVGKERLTYANSWLTTSNQVAAGAGFYLGGFMDAKFGAASCVWVSCTFLFVSVLFFFCIKASIQDPKEQSNRWEGFRETWSFVYKHPYIGDFLCSIR